MSEFRWILIGLAIIVFVGTLIWSRFAKSKSGRNLFDQSSNLDDFDKDILYADDPLEIQEDFGVSEVRIIKPDTHLDSGSGLTTHTSNTLSTDQGNLSESEDSANKLDTDDSNNSNPEDAQHIVVLHVTARPGETFKGKKVCKTLEHLGLRHGKYKIYHRESLQNPDISLFSVANMVKPGFFEPDALEVFSTPGISFFLVLPGPPDPMTTFNEMVQTARQVAQSLDGDLLDAERSSFSNQRSQMIQDDIVNFMHRYNDE